MYSQGGAVVESHRVAFDGTDISLTGDVFIIGINCKKFLK